jgi:hypothetical protein
VKNVIYAIHTNKKAVTSEIMAYADSTLHDAVQLAKGNSGCMIMPYEFVIP